MHIKFVFLLEDNPFKEQGDLSVQVGRNLIKGNYNRKILLDGLKL